MNTKTNSDARPDRTIHSLTNELLEDLFNPSISTLDLCQIHGLTLPELAAILESESFKLAVDCTRRINTARQSIIESEAATLAAARLHDLIKDRPQTPAHAETVRKATASILRQPTTKPHATSPAPAREAPAQPTEGALTTIHQPPHPPETPDTRGQRRASAAHDKNRVHSEPRPMPD